MSDDRVGTAPTRICLVGATGMIGKAIIAAAARRSDIDLVAIARRPVALPAMADSAVSIGDTMQWPDLIAAANAEVMICALGTTRAKAGTPEAFAAIDRDLVLACGRAARSSGIGRMVVVSSVAADAHSRNLYLRTKGEMEEGLAALGFARLDVLRPAQLMGAREERRPLERLGQVAIRGLDIVLHGPLRRYHSIPSRDVAGAALALAATTTTGRFVHEHDAIVRAARSTKVAG